jgi:Family of unknown function (DUF6440)
MKKTLLVLGSVTFLFGCSATQASGSQEERFKKDYKDNDIYIVTDKKTDCKYLMYDGGNEGGITPLLNEFGRPDCGK